MSREAFRIDVGGPDCRQPYSASVFNISAMSFGALSANAIRSLNRGAKIGGFAHDTGEGGFSPYHKEGGGDVIWEIGSGYFGCRRADGGFDPDKFASAAANPQIKMIEIKLSQGAKPGHGGVLPGPKVTAEIAAIRGVAQGEDCVSPARHGAFSTPRELCAFIARLRELSGGKPVGFKLCIGQPWEFLGVCKAMLETGIYPDFIVVDGKEGGTGAAPLEFADHIGAPLREGLVFVRNALNGIGAKDRVRIGCSGKIVTAFDMAVAFALGADWCNSRARLHVLARLHPVAELPHRPLPHRGGDPGPGAGARLVVADKTQRVANFHSAMLHSLAEITAAAGLEHPNDFRPEHFSRRASATRGAILRRVVPGPAEGRAARQYRGRAMGAAVGDGERGELCVGGVSVGMTGWRATRKTRRRAQGASTKTD